MAWENDLSEMKGAGFPDDAIAAEGQKRRDEMAANGFPKEEIDKYFGVKEPDFTPVKNMLSANLNMKAEEYKAMQAEGKKTPNQDHSFDSFVHSLEVGFDASTSAMMVRALRGKRATPEELAPEDADMFHRIASQVGTLAGDLPAMTLGSVVGGIYGGAAGGAAGTVTLPVVGTVGGAVAGASVGASAGAFAMPAAIRKTLMEFYDKGEIHDFQDFWSRFSAATIDTVKEGTIGGISGGVGGKVLQGAGKIAGPAAARIASTSSEIATMVTLGKAFEGQAPAAQDFLDAALVIGALHVATGTASKIRKIYAETGTLPHAVAEEAQTNPVLKEQLLDNSKDLPDTYKVIAESNPDNPSMKINGMEPAAKAEIPVVKPESEMTDNEYIRSKIQSKPEKIKKPYTKDDFYKDFVDKFDPIKKIEDTLTNGKNLDTAQSGYQLMRMANDAPAKTAHFLGDAKNPNGGGTIDYESGRTTGPSLMKVIKPVENEVRRLEEYMVAKRAVELHGRGIDPGFDLERAKGVVAKDSAKFDKIAQGVTEVHNAAAKYLKDSGVISQEVFDKMTSQNQAYIPLKRILEDGSTSGGTKGKLIKQITGSDLNVQDPMISLTENVDMYLRAAEINKARLKFVDNVLGEPGQAHLEKVKTPMKAIEVGAEELSAALKKQGYDIDPETITIFRKADRPLAHNEFEVYREGKREIYKATDPNVAEAIRLLDGSPQTQNIFVKVARAITTTKRAGITLATDFQFRNLGKDFFTSGVLSKTGSVNVMDVLSAAGNIWAKDDHYFNWLKSGGAGGAFMKISEQYGRENIYKLNDEVGFLNKVRNVLSKPIHYAEMFGSLAENATRLAEFKRVVGDQTEGPAILRGGMAAREVTVDFQRNGLKTAAANQIVAFMNVGVQGLDRTGRAFKEDWKGITGKGILWITAPSLILYFLNKDDKRVAEIPQWEKDTHWIIPLNYWDKESVPGEHANLPEHLVRQNEDGSYSINRGPILRFPKPQEIGFLFGTVPERILDAYFKDNPDKFKHFGESLLSLVTPALMPDAIAPVLEQMTNHNFFTGSKIVPGNLEGQLPETQYTNYTTETAKALGKMIMAVPFIGDAGPKNSPLASPMVLENYVRSWTGTSGMYALNLMDAALKKAGIVDYPSTPAWAISDIPVVKAFVVKYPSMNSESIKTFFENFDENSRVLKSIQASAKAGNADQALAITNDRVYQQRMLDLSGVKDALTNQSELIKMITKDPDMKPDEKRQLIDGLYFGMIETAKAANESNEEFKKQMKELAGEK